MMLGMNAADERATQVSSATNSAEGTEDPTVHPLKVHHPFVL